MNNEIIKLIKISKKFTSAGKKSIHVLKNINLKINKGELISLTGPSGSGKSTLLHIIALLDLPTSGEVFFNKKNFLVVYELSFTLLSTLSKKDLFCCFMKFCSTYY